MGVIYRQGNVIGNSRSSSVSAANGLWNLYELENRRRNSIWPEQIVRSGLVLYIDPGINESYPGTGTSILDISGNGGTGTLTNGPTYSSSNGGVITLDGTNDSIPITSSALSWTPSQFSICWFTRGISRVNFNQQMFATGGWGRFVFHTDSGGAIYCGTETTNRFTPTQLPNNTYVLNVYQMFCFTYVSGSGRFYKNGTLLATKAMNASLNWSGFTIGSPDTNSINGTIGAVQIYNRALSLAEINQNFNALRNRYGI